MTVMTVDKKSEHASQKTAPSHHHCLTRESLQTPRELKVHYSFDYAQQVHYPCDPLQPGPIFFLTPRKCSIFGVHCEAIPRQVNFLGDEAGDCGKGANTVISQLHYYFEHHGLGETEVYLHADNCTGQNKNSCMIHYLCWRCMTGRHTKATISFMVVGHTKFAPDWCFFCFCFRALSSTMQHSSHNYDCKL